MIPRVTTLLFFVCLMPGLLLGSTDGMKKLGLRGNESAHPDTSASDAWGYTWVRSTDPGGPTFNWVDISTTGTLVGGLTDDNVSAQYNMLFNFPYYWYTANRFKVGSNGYIQFDNTTTAFASPFGTTFPSTAIPNDLMAICTGDLVFSGQSGAGGQCYYWTNAVDSLVVSFINVTEWESVIAPANTHTFQIILNKADSSITYQYGKQAAYNTTNNTRLVIGIENATGQIGLQYANSTAPPAHPLMPDSGLAIKIKRTVNTGLAVTDAGIVGGLNVTNLGEMTIVGVAKTIRCVVKNFGTAPITNASVRYSITKAGQPTALDTVIVPSLAAGQETTVTFPDQFTPAVTGSYSALFNVTVAGDVGPGNNSKTTEITSSTFSTTQNTVVQYEAGTAGGSINWIGGGGMGVAIDLPDSAYAARIESVYVSINAITTQPMIVQILDGSTGSPGAVLAERTSVTAVVGMNGIDFRSDSVTITGGRFFIGARGQVAFNYELTAPISNRSWEYTGGWAPYRSADLQDVIMRVSVRKKAPPVTTTTLNVAIAAGWNLISNPVTNPIPGDSVRQMYPTSLNAYAFEFSGGYVQKFKLANGKGYWEKFPGAISNPVTGTLRTNDSISVVAGWNIVGSISCVVDTSTIVTVPVGIRASNWFGYSGGYTAVTQLIPGKGYWIKCSTSGTIVFICPPLGRQVNESVVDAINTLNTLTITDANGGSQTLYFGADGQKQIPVAMYTMPPAPPVGAFDARFETADGGSMVQTHGVEMSTPVEFAVSVQSEAYPLTVTWKVANASYTFSDGVQFKDMTGEGSMKITNSSASRFSVTLTGDSQLPKDYALSQNYPNPFNPTTSITYALPVDSKVTMEIYNLVGQRVRTLVNDNQTAGYHAAEWNGVGNSGQQLSSGVYFLHLSAKGVNGASFNELRKLMLLK